MLAVRPCADEVVGLVGMKTAIRPVGLTHIRWAQEVTDCRIWLTCAGFTPASGVSDCVRKIVLDMPKMFTLERLLGDGPPYGCRFEFSAQIESLSDSGEYCLLVYPDMPIHRSNLTEQQLRDYWKGCE